MRMQKVNKTIKAGLKYVVPVVASGLIVFGSVGTVSADDGHGYRDGPRHYRNADYDNDRWHRGLKRGHFKHHKRHGKVKVYHHYRNHPVSRVRVIHHYYEPEPVYIERRRVIEHRRYVEPAPVYHSGAYYGPSGSSLIGAAIGGLLGSQVGKGDGKLAATAAGAVTGYWIGGQH